MLSCVVGEAWVGPSSLGVDVVLCPLLTSALRHPRPRFVAAGVATIAPILEATVEDWDWTMNVRNRRDNSIEVFRIGNCSREGPFQRDT